MNWAFYLAAVLVPIGIVAIVFAPSTSKNSDRKVGFYGMLTLGAGMMAFLLGLVLSGAH